MTAIIRRVIPVFTDEGLIVKIPYSAWSDVQRVAEEEFDAEITFHLHNLPGAYHGFAFVPLPHYSIEVELDEDLVDAFKERINPLVNAIIESHTQQPEVPAGM